jgi:hypothetical protein
MREVEVNCANRLSGCDRHGRVRGHWHGHGHEDITHVGHSVHHWRLRRDVVVRRIESGAEAYYLLDKATGERVCIGVVREPGRWPYLRARRRDTWTDHLLELPECGRTCELIG